MPVAYDHGLLCLNDGLLWDIVACYLALKVPSRKSASSRHIPSDLRRHGIRKGFPRRDLNYGRMFCQWFIVVL